MSNNNYPFKLGFCWCWPPEDLDKRIPALKQLGYDGVEFWDGSLILMDIDRLADLMQSTGLNVSQLNPYFNFVDGQEMWDDTMRMAEKYIAWAVKLGAPLLRVFTGKPWGDKMVGAYKATPAQWDASILGLQRICDMAAPHNVGLALECHMGSLMEDSLTTLRLLKGVSRPNLGVNIQLPLGHGEDIYDSIENLGQYAVHMHTHNWDNWPAEKATKLVCIAEGKLDYHPVMRALRKKGFSGYVAVEHPDHCCGDDPWRTAEVDARYLTALRQDIMAEEKA